MDEIVAHHATANPEMDMDSTCMTHMDGTDRKEIARRQCIYTSLAGLYQADDVSKHWATKIVSLIRERKQCNQLSKLH